MNPGILAFVLETWSGCIQAGWGSDLWPSAVVLWNSASHVSTMLRSNLALPIIRSLIFYRALTLMGHCKHKEEYANLISSTNHLEILCFVTGPPLAWLPKPKKICSDFLYEADCSMYTFRALTGQSRGSWLPIGVGGGKHGKCYDLGSE